jgi:predicted phage tail protein
MPSATPELKTVRLGGELGRKFGRAHHLAVTNPAEAVRALCANYPEFRTHLIESDGRGVAYKVLVGGEPLPSVDQIHNPSGRLEIRIMPVIRGASKAGIFEIVGGVLLMAAGVALAATGVGTVFAPLVFSIGLSLTLGGVAQLLSPQPKTPANTQASYVFGGPANTLAAGMPIPICYGNLIVGGAIISGGISVDQVSTTQTGIPGLTATVQETTSGGVSTFQLYASWQPAGDAIGYDVTINGPGVGSVQLARTNGTSVYYTVPGAGPYEVIVNPVEAGSTSTIAGGTGTNYGPTASVWSSFLAG